MAQTGDKIYTTRAEKYTDSPFEYTGAVEANTEFLPDGTTPDPNFVANETNLTDCPLNPPPVIPVGLVATNVSYFDFDLSWTASSGATGYKVYKDNVLYLDVGNVITKLIVNQVPNIGAVWSVVAYSTYGSSSPSTGLAVNQLALGAVDLSDTGYDDEIDACAGGPGDGTINKWFDGTATYPTNNNILYDNAAGSSTFNGGNQFWYDKNGDRSYEINTSGKILDDLAC